jgi:MinD-like ATPase involved in chromosome partitioning or flagellar assembly
MTRHASVVAVTSGKGGVGKTHIAANLGIMLAKQGRRTCLIDADHGLANINLILGLVATQPPKNLFEPDCDLISVMINTDYGVDVLPSYSGISQTTIEGQPDQTQIFQLFERLKPHYDVIIVDTSAGIDRNVKNYLAAADHALLIINSEPTSLTDAFGLVRKMKNIQPFYNIIINRVSNAAAATAIYKRFAGAVRKYIGAQLGAIGYISEDSFVSAAVLSQTPVVSYSPSCLASQSIKRIARSLSKKIIEQYNNAPNSAQQANQEHLQTNSGETNDRETEIGQTENEQPESNHSGSTAESANTRQTYGELQHTEAIDESGTTEPLASETENQAPDTSEQLEQPSESNNEIAASNNSDILSESEDMSTSEPVAEEVIPSQPSFIQAGTENDPYESWLAQLSSFLLPKKATEKTRLSRKRQLIAELEMLCDEDPSLLPELESLVMKNSLKHSKSVMDQANITNRLANTRFVDEPSMSGSYSQADTSVSKKVFSIISKLK